MPYDPGPAMLLTRVAVARPIKFAMNLITGTAAFDVAKVVVDLD